MLATFTCAPTNNQYQIESLVLDMYAGNIYLCANK